MGRIVLGALTAALLALPASSMAGEALLQAGPSYGSTDSPAIMPSGRGGQSAIVDKPVACPKGQALSRLPGGSTGCAERPRLPKVSKPDNPPLDAGKRPAPITPAGGAQTAPAQEPGSAATDPGPVPPTGDVGPVGPAWTGNTGGLSFDEDPGWGVRRSTAPAFLQDDCEFVYESCRKHFLFTCKRALIAEREEDFDELQKLIAALDGMVDFCVAELRTLDCYDAALVKTTGLIGYCPL